MSVRQIKHYLFSPLFFILVWFFPLMASAQILTITPNPPLPSLVGAGTTTTGIYIVTNNCNFAVTPINQSQLPPGFTIVGSTCGVLIQPHQSCSITVSYTAPNTAGTVSTQLQVLASPTSSTTTFPIVITTTTQQFTVTPSAGPNGTISPNTPQQVIYGGSRTFTATPAPNYVVDQWFVDGAPVQNGGNSYTISNVTANHTVRVTFKLAASGIAAGFSGTNTPLIVQTTDNGTTWGQTTVSGSPAAGIYNGTTCTGLGSTAVCAAVGQNITANSPLISVTMDGNATWATVPTIVNPPGAGSFLNSVSCTGAGATAVCSAVGGGSNTAALIINSTDGGTTWTTFPAGSIGGVLPADSNLDGVSCTGAGVSATCATVGATDTGAPFIINTTTGTGAWTAQPVAGAPAQGEFYTVSCSGGTCVAGGVNNTAVPSRVLLASSQDGGNTWATVTAPGTIIDSEIRGSSCIVNGSLCVVSGGGTSSAPARTPFIDYSTDFGLTFTRVNVPGVGNGILNAVSCTGAGLTAVCTAAGQNYATQAPLLFVSTNGGTSWTVKTATGATPLGGFTGASCSGNGPTAYCTASGTSTGGAPILAQSIDGGTTWTYVTSGLPATGGLNDTSTTSNSILQKVRHKNRG